MYNAIQVTEQLTKLWQQNSGQIRLKSDAKFWQRTITHRPSAVKISNRRPHKFFATKQMLHRELAVNNLLKFMRQHQTDIGRQLATENG